MITMTNVLLLFIFFLLCSDLFFLSKINRKIGHNQKSDYDERYFELKYHINLLKSASAILISVLGLLGYNTITTFNEEIKVNLTESIKLQQDTLAQMKTQLTTYSDSIESLNEFREELQLVMGVSKKEMKGIIYKIKSIQESSLSNPKFYFVDDLTYSYDQNSKDPAVFNFADMTTKDGEELPIFENSPYVSIQGNGIGLDVIKVTTTHAGINYDQFLSDYSDVKSGDYTFNLLIVSH